MIVKTWQKMMQEEVSKMRDKKWNPEGWKIWLKKSDKKAAKDICQYIFGF